MARWNSTASRVWILFIHLSVEALTFVSRIQGSLGQLFKFCRNCGFGWRVSLLWLLWRVLFWMLLTKFSWEYPFSLLSGFIYRGWIADDTVALCSTAGGTARLFSKGQALLCILTGLGPGRSPKQRWGTLTQPHPRERLQAYWISWQEKNFLHASVKGIKNILHWILKVQTERNRVGIHREA